MPQMGSANSPPLRVLLVDDHEVVRSGVKAMLQATDDIVVSAEAGSVREAVDEADRTRPAVVIMDVRLADGAASKPPARSGPTTRRPGS
jgi:two-component system, NarL family, response regulator DevR